MARDGSGNYSLPQAAFSSGTTIESAKVNSDFSDIASALTQSISKDGQTTYTASQPMGGFKLTGLGAGSGAGESIRYDEFKAAFRSFLAGLGMSNNVSPNTKVDVAAGSWTEVGQATVLANVAGTIDCGTTGANGLDAGSLANSTWYHAYAIGKTDLTTALLASTSVSSPTMPSGYTLKRRIGSFKTNGSAQIIAFTQTGDEFVWAAPVLDINTVAISTLTTQTLSVPTGVKVTAVFAAAAANTITGGIGFWSPDVTTVTNTIQSIGWPGNGQSATAARIQTNTSGQIMVSGAFGGGGFVTLSTTGWVDRRGRDS